MNNELYIIMCLIKDTLDLYGLKKKAALTRAAFNLSLFVPLTFNFLILDLFVDPIKLKDYQKLSVNNVFRLNSTIVGSPIS